MKITERTIDDKISLIPYYENYDESLSRYQDYDLCKQVDNIDYLYDKDKIKKRIKTCYNIDKKTSEELGANIVALGDGRILTSNKTVFHILKKADFEVFYLDYSEILKAGGGFTCSTLYFYIE